MSRRAKRPLNAAAVQAANNQFYANHPELVQDGKRVPLDPQNPAQTALRKEWMDFYVANGGAVEDSSPKPPQTPVQPCPVTVTVKITLSAAVACPGHPLPIAAVGTPSGGTYSWTVSGGGAELVDGAVSPISTGPNVNLRSFQPDDATGNIPAKTATVSVTYTHPNGTATDTKPVPIHAIDFEVTDTGVTAGVTQANETATSVALNNAPGTATMSTNPKVKIKLDPSCPRKVACASNHRAAWLQTMLSDTREGRYRHTLITFLCPMPIRDALTSTATKPFYDEPIPFTADQQQLTVHHEDSPGITGVPWSDPRPGAPAPPPPTNRRLLRAAAGNSFNAWLVVQNIEWSAHHRDQSFVFVGHFDWSMLLRCTVDVTQAVGSRCTPASVVPPLGAFSRGKGGASPVLTDPIYNTTATLSTTPAPAI